MPTLPSRSSPVKGRKNVTYPSLADVADVPLTSFQALSLDCRENIDRGKQLPNASQKKNVMSHGKSRNVGSVSYCVTEGTSTREPEDDRNQHIPAMGEDVFSNAASGQATTPHILGPLIHRMVVDNSGGSENEWPCSQCPSDSDSGEVITEVVTTVTRTVTRTIKRSPAKAKGNPKMPVITSIPARGSRFPPPPNPLTVTDPSDPGSRPFTPSPTLTSPTSSTLTNESTLSDSLGFNLPVARDRSTAHVPTSYVSGCGANIPEANTNVQMNINSRAPIFGVGQQGIPRVYNSSRYYIPCPDELAPPPLPATRMSPEYYVVIRGQLVGIFGSWTEVAPLVTGIPGNIHKSFKCWADALNHYRGAYNRGDVAAIPIAGGPYDVPFQF